MDEDVRTCGSFEELGFNTDFSENVLFNQQTKAELYLKPAECFSFPKQAFYPLGLQRERDLCIPESVLILLHPFITQGTVSKQPAAEAREVTLSGGSTEAPKPSHSYLCSLGSFLMASVKYWTAVSYCPEAAKR